eukprot:16207839-Heterocapsa_arctica.AAC.1
MTFHRLWRLEEAQQTISARILVPDARALKRCQRFRVGKLDGPAGENPQCGTIRASANGASKLI